MAGDASQAFNSSAGSLTLNHRTAVRGAIG
jgi:hypothetical protein